MKRTSPYGLVGWNGKTKAELSDLVDKAVEKREVEVRFNHWTFCVNEAKSFLSK